jgi:hypothetical protein
VKRTLAAQVALPRISDGPIDGRKHYGSRGLQVDEIFGNGPPIGLGPPRQWLLGESFAQASSLLIDRVDLAANLLEFRNQRHKKLPLRKNTA